MAKWHFLDSFFYPSSVAIVGASRSPLTLNYNLVSNLVKLGFRGEIYPVNPNADEILGTKAYARLKDIDSEIDLVVSAVPAHMTLDIVKQCAEKRVKGVVLVAGGFSEANERGRRVQDEIAHLLKQAGIRAIGPNALSPINTANNLVVSFLPVERLTRGGVSFVFQSGLYDPKLNWILSDFHLGISKLIDLGNKMDINEVDALEYLAQDLDTKVIAMHLETLKGGGKKFMQLLDNTSKAKPIVVLKSGRSTAGAKAAASHTGSMAKESNIVFDAVLRQSRVVGAQTLDDFFDFAKAFGLLTPPSGNRIVVASLSGGEGVIATDICQQNGFSMAKPNGRTFGRLKPFFPPWEIPLNPFDIGVCTQFHPTDEVYSVFLESMVGDENVDCLIVGLPPFFPSLGTDKALRPFLLGKEKGKPVVVWPHAMTDSLHAVVEELELNGVPVYPSVTRAIRALSVVYKYKMIQERAA